MKLDSQKHNANSSQIQVKYHTLNKKYIFCKNNYKNNKNNTAVIYTIVIISHTLQMCL